MSVELEEQVRRGEWLGKKEKKEGVVKGEEDER